MLTFHSPDIYTGFWMCDPMLIMSIHFLEHINRHGRFSSSYPIQVVIGNKACLQHVAIITKYTFTCSRKNFAMLKVTSSHVSHSIRRPNNTYHPVLEVLSCMSAKALADSLNECVDVVNVV